MNNGAKILVIDDEKAIRRFLEVSLESSGYQVYLAKDGESGIKIANEERPDIVILDLELPDIHGLDVLKNIRKKSDVPILILTVRSSEESKILLLDAGADDYLTKPFSIGELLVRIRVALRHGMNTIENETYKNGPLEIYFGERKVFMKGKEIKLTVIEYDLLKMLAKYAGKIITQQMILKEIWGDWALENSHYLRIYIGQLRKKLEDEPNNPKLITTEPGVGYRLNIL